MNRDRVAGTEDAASGNTESTPPAESESQPSSTNMPSYEGIERINFKPGTSSGAVKGSVKGYDRKDYVVNARKGQEMTVNLKSSSTFVYFNISDAKDGFALETDPRPLDVTTWKGALPQDGDYFIRVYLVRAEARRNGTADFTLDVAIEGKPDKDREEVVLDKPFFYMCPEPMEVVATFREDQGKRKAEIEIGDTVLRLDLKPSGSGSKYADEGEKNIFWVKGDEALFEYRGKSYTCKRT